MPKNKSRKKKIDLISLQNKKNQPQNDYDLKFLKNILIFISLFVYLIIFPPFLKNQALAGHDSGIHLTYLRLFTDTLYQGQFPVRWIEWITPGQSQPLFSYYQPLLYYLGQIPHLLSFDILNSLYATVVFFWLFSGLLTYLFIKNITKNSLAGFVASCLYIFAPYHILDVLVRAAYPESIALALIPGIFWACERLINTQKRIYVLFFALFIAMTFVAHPPTVLIFSFPLFFYICFLLYEKLKSYLNLKSIIKNTTNLAFSFILAIGLSSFFAIPALLQQNLTKASSLNIGYLDFHDHFVCLNQLFWSSWDYGTSALGCSDQISFQVGIVNWIVIISIIALLAFFYYKKIFNKLSKQTIFWLITVFFGIYMTLSISQPFWEGIPYFSFLQFPWRFLSIVILSTAILSGLLFTYFKNEFLKILLFIIFMILTPLLSYSFLQPAAFLPKDYFAQDSQDFYKATAQGQLSGSPITGYFPKSMEVLPEQGSVPASGISVSSQNAAIKVVKSNFVYKEFLISSSSPQNITLFIHYFPGWKFSINNKFVNPDYSNVYDFVNLSAPSGKNKIVAKFENTPLISISNLISLLSILFFIVLFTFELIKIIKGKIKRE